MQLPANTTPRGGVRRGARTRWEDTLGSKIMSAPGDGDGRAETTQTATVRHTRAPSAHLLRQGDGPTRSASSPRSSGVVGGHVLPWGPRRAPQSFTSSPRWFLLVRFTGSQMHHAVSHPAVCNTTVATGLLRRWSTFPSLPLAFPTMCPNANRQPPLWAMRWHMGSGGGAIPTCPRRPHVFRAQKHGPLTRPVPLVGMPSSHVANF